MAENNISLGAETAIRRWIKTGEIPPGTWLRESALAAELGISRTPVREACNRLARDGLLEWMPRRGYRLPPLDPAELDAVYPVLIVLEALAVELVTEPVAVLAAALLAPDLSVSTDPSTVTARYEIDRLWHRRIITATSNPVLLELHDRLTERIARHLYAYWRRRHDVERSADEHAQIAAALARDDRQLATALLRSHRRYGLEHIRALMV